MIGQKPDDGLLPMVQRDWRKKRAAPLQNGVMQLTPAGSELRVAGFMHVVGRPEEQSKQRIEHLLEGVAVVLCLRTGYMLPSIENGPRYYLVCSCMYVMEEYVIEARHPVKEEERWHCVLLNCLILPHGTGRERWLVMQATVAFRCVAHTCHRGSIWILTWPLEHLLRQGGAHHIVYVQGTGRRECWCAVFSRALSACTYVHTTYLSRYRLLAC